MVEARRPHDPLIGLGARRLEDTLAPPLRTPGSSDWA
jgi:hypothetical protein